MLVNKLKELRNGGDEEGFTLIELLIVIVIIGILAAIAIPIFANQQREATYAGVKSDVRNTVTNVSTFLVRNPTATVVQMNAIVAPLGVTRVQSAGNTVTITGTNWENYVVRGVTAGDTLYNYDFSASTGRYVEERLLTN